MLVHLRQNTFPRQLSPPLDHNNIHPLNLPPPLLPPPQSPHPSHLQDIESVLPLMIQKCTTTKSAFDDYDHDPRSAPSPVGRPGPDLTEPEACHQLRGSVRVSKHLPPFSLSVLRSKSSMCALHTSQPPAQPRPVLKILSYQMLTYPLVCMLIWVLPTG